MRVFTALPLTAALMISFVLCGYSGYAVHPARAQVSRSTSIAARVQKIGKISDADLATVLRSTQNINLTSKQRADAFSALYLVRTLTPSQKETVRKSLVGLLQLQDEATDKEGTVKALVLDFIAERAPQPSYYEPFIKQVQSGDSRTRVKKQAQEALGKIHTLKTR